MANNRHHRGHLNDGQINNINLTHDNDDDGMIEAVFYEDFGDAEWDDEEILFEAHEALTKLNQRSSRRETLERKPKRAEQWR